MASTATSLLLLLSAVSLLAVAGATTAAAAGPAISCTVGHGIPDPQYPLPGCGWYVRSRSCKWGNLGGYPAEIYRELCCQQLEAIPAACRCTALRLTVANPLNMGPGGRGTEECRLAQARSARSLVTKAECGLPAVHGWPTCSGPGGE